MTAAPRSPPGSAASPGLRRSSACTPTPRTRWRAPATCSASASSRQRRRSTRRGPAAWVRRARPPAIRCERGEHGECREPRGVRPPREQGSGEAVKVAVVDLGTNSARLLLAAVEQGVVRDVARADDGDPPGRRRRPAAAHRPRRRGAHARLPGGLRCAGWRPTPPTRGCWWRPASCATPPTAAPFSTASRNEFDLPWRPSSAAKQEAALSFAGAVSAAGASTDRVGHECPAAGRRRPSQAGRRQDARPSPSSTSAAAASSWRSARRRRPRRLSSAAST